MKSTTSRYAVLFFLFALATGLAATPLRALDPAQEDKAAASSVATAEGLAALLSARFSAGDSAAFDSVYPFAPGRELVAEAARRGATRHAGLARVLSQTDTDAILLLSGYTARGHSGVETLLGRAYSDFYRAERQGDRWTITERLPLDAESRIISHRLGVTVIPGEGVAVVDTLTVAVNGTRGFAARLNHAAALTSVAIDGQSVDPVFAAGLFWVPVAPGRAVTLTIDYRLKLPNDPESWLSYALPNSGFVRDQALWHPVLNYNTTADRATFAITARIPARFHLATSIAQEDWTEEEVGWRVVRGRTSEPVAGLSLAYDAEWEPYLIEGEGLRFEAFVTAGFLPTRTALDSAFRRALRVLASRFGAPRAGDYFAVVQRREATSSGWHMLSNATMITGRNGGPASRAAPTPRAFVAHELAHRWTAPTGPGAFLLMEGWATLAESYVLADEYGPEVERAFWESQRRSYEQAGFEGSQSILLDETNGGIAYSKGSWILRMLCDDLGAQVFDRGMRDYLAIPAGRDAGIAAFSHALSEVSGRDVAALLRPWIEERTIPAIGVAIGDGAIILRQEGPVFDLPLEIEIVTGATSSRRRVRLSARTLRVELPQGAVVSAVILDPDHRLLIRRQSVPAPESGR